MMAIECTNGGRLNEEGCPGIPPGDFEERILGRRVWERRQNTLSWILHNLEIWHLPVGSRTLGERLNQWLLRKRMNRPRREVDS